MKIKKNNFALYISNLYLANVIDRTLAIVECFFFEKRR